tara:strand:- start:30 stop:1493 length:1464 start_codon:yes stop_codon:yes gene_type:complete
MAIAGDVSNELITVGDDIEILPPAMGKGMKTVMKFGGSSLANAERIMYVSKLIMKHFELGYKPVIVCSAMGKTTNSLLSAGDFALDGSVYIDSLRTLHTTTIRQLGLPESTLIDIENILTELQTLLEGIKCIGELTPRTKDFLVSFGERMSVRIVAANLNKLGVPSQGFDSWTIGMQTNSEFGNAEVLPKSYDKIKETLDKFDSMMVPVVTGFLGADPNNRITTLGRGGSDLTATILGAGLSVDEVQVWKDVDGIMTADPRLVPSALPVNAVTYEEAAELASFGAEVLHPISMQPAILTNIPVRVKNSYNPSAIGTIITADRDMSDALVTAITSKNNIETIDIISTRMLGAYGFLSTVFRLFEECQVSVDVVASSDVSVSVTIDKKNTLPENIHKLVSKLQKFADASILKERCIVSIISNLNKSSEVMTTTFGVMKRLGIQCEMLSQGASKVNISIVVQMAEKDALIKALHAVFFEEMPLDDIKPID